MPQVDSIRRFFDALGRRDLEAASALTGANFQVDGPGHVPLWWKDWCLVQQAIWSAFPDLRYDVTDLEEGFALGAATVRIGGTFLHDLALPFRGLPVIPATGELVLCPAERLGFTLEYGEILTVRTESPTGYGLLGPAMAVGAEVAAPGLLG